MRVFALLSLLLSVCVAFDGPQQVFAPTSDLGSSQFRVVTHDRVGGYQLRVKERKGIPLCDDDVVQYSGYLDVADGDHIFFWFFEARNHPKTAPLAAWFNGGPGGSSAMGLLMELGPCDILPNGTGTEPNPYSWNNNANIVFIDQPLTVGYSYTERNTIVSSSERAAVDIYNFFQLFYTAFPKYSKLPFYLTGESYAGHYIPAFATEIVKRNTENASGSIHIPLDSIVMGNALVDPHTQVAAAPEWLCNGPYSDLVVGEEGSEEKEKECKALRAQAARCQKMIAFCNARPSRWTCAPALACRFLPFQANPVGKKKLNPFDVRIPCVPTSTGTCYIEDEWIGILLNRPEVKEALGVPEKVKFGPSDTVGYAFAASGDGTKNAAVLIPALLDAGVRVLNYAGKADSRCDYFGNLAWMSKVDHPLAREFGQAPLQAWYSDDEEAGEIVRLANYTFLAVNDGGHLLPYDQGKVSLDMFDRWVAGEL